jgi:hypothetical protein
LCWRTSDKSERDAIYDVSNPAKDKMVVGDWESPAARL